MGPNPGLIDSLNAIREQTVKDGKVYHQYVPVITDTTSIAEFATPILTNTEVANEFMSQLIKRIVYTAITVKNFRNPLSFLEKETMPLGYQGQEIYVNPAKGRQFNSNDFAGLLQKYEADVKVQYTQVNMDIQYPVSVTREKLRSAFVSWESLNSFIDALTASIYNSAYIDRYKFTKLMVSSAYRENRVKVQTISAVSDATTAKAALKAARAAYLNFQAPSTQYNAWNQVGGDGAPITTWSNPEDVVILIRNDVLATMDVDAFATLFHRENAELLGRVVGVDSFDIYNDAGEKIFDGSAIQFIMADRAWFNIRMQDFAFDEFYNANNRAWNYYLNQVMLYNFSLFANAIVFASSAPTVPATKIEVAKSTISLKAGATASTTFALTPAQATSTVTAASSDSTTATAAVSGKTVTITGKAAGSATITLTAGDGITDTIAVTVTAASA